MHETDRYAYPHRVLHWLVAAVLLFSLATGLTLGTLGFEGARDTLGMAVTNLLYTTHKTLGVIILGLMIARVVTRSIFVVPLHDPPLSAFQYTLSHSVHALLYLVLLIQPVLGWVATATGGFPVQFFHWTLPPLMGENEALSEQLYTWHAWVGWTILVLIALHIAGAFYHWLLVRDGVMKRMSLF